MQKTLLMAVAGLLIASHCRAEDCNELRQKMVTLNLTATKMAQDTNTLFNDSFCSATNSCRTSRGSGNVYCVLREFQTTRALYYRQCWQQAGLTQDDADNKAMSADTAAAVSAKSCVR